MLEAQHAYQAKITRITQKKQKEKKEILDYGQILESDRRHKIDRACSLEKAKKRRMARRLKQLDEQSNQLQD